MYIFNTLGKFAKLKPQIDGFKTFTIISINFLTAYSWRGVFKIYHFYELKFSHVGLLYKPFFFLQIFLCPTF